MLNKASRRTETQPGEFQLGDIACRCPKHKTPLTQTHPNGLKLVCESGCFFDIKDGIPRFVPPDTYAESFGLQWKSFRKTQLDSVCGLPISSTRLTRMLGGSLDVVRGKRVLEAGCGAGRFTEILLNAGANVTAVDISIAVEANKENFEENFPHLPDNQSYQACQASILELPFAPEQFDIVICAGVVQHTPNSEQTIAALCSQVKHGGMLVIDHYTHWPAPTPMRELLRKILVQVPPQSAFEFVTQLTDLLWPAHQYFYNNRHVPEMNQAWQTFLQLSPIVDLQLHNPPFQDQNLAKEWSMLCTHDTTTDFYKHLRTLEEVTRCLADCGMTGVQAEYAGNGVEARAVKPWFQNQS